jgi:hypothetical protein
VVEAQLVAIVEGRRVLGQCTIQADDALVLRRDPHAGQRVGHPGALGQIQRDVLAPRRQMAPHLAEKQHPHPHGFLPPRF